MLVGTSSGGWVALTTDPVASVSAALGEVSPHDAGQGAFREAREASIALLREFVKRFSV